MKILFLSSYFYPHIGGVEKHAFEVGKELIKRGHKVTVITENSQKEKTKESEQGIKVVRLRFGRNDWFKKFRIWSKIWKNRKLIQESDIVHCHDVFFWYLPFRFLYPRKKVYNTFHGYEGKFPPALKAIIVRRIGEELSFGNITVGRYIKKWYGTKPTFITFGAADKVNFKVKPKNLKGKLRILLIGRLEEDIGSKTYLETLEILKKNGTKFDLVVLGDGPYRKKFKKFGKVTGFVKNTESYLKQADIVLASSYLSILEAMVNRKLVFSVFDNPLKEDYLKMSPFKRWIIIKDSPEDLASEVENYLKKPNKFSRNIQQAQSFARNQTWTKLASLYLRLYK